MRGFGTCLLTRLGSAPWIAAMSLLALALLAGAEEPRTPTSRVARLLGGADEPRSPTPPVAEREDQEPQRVMREGDALTRAAGVFQMAGNRLTFVEADSRRKFTVLENLNLERVARIISDSPQETEWVVTGTVTEFQGTNYLLVVQATRKTRTLPSVPRPQTTEPSATPPPS